MKSFDYNLIFYTILILIKIKNLNYLKNYSKFYYLIKLNNKFFILIGLFVCEFSLLFE